MIALVAICALLGYTEAAISCRDSGDFDIPWFAAYKMPKMKAQPVGSVTGLGLYYLDSKNRKELRPSPVPINSSYQAVAYTLSAYYTNINDPNLLHVFYNDEPAVNASTPAAAQQDIEENVVDDEQFSTESVEFGHSKGVILFDGPSSTGIWLIHSVPKFPPPDVYQYPTSGEEYGQTFLCLTLDARTLAQLGTALFYNHPDIYSHSLPDWVAQISPDMVKVLNGDYNKDASSTSFHQPIHVVNESANSPAMEVFAKSHLFNDDLWAAAVAPVFGALDVESWRRGDLIDTNCSSLAPVFDAQEIKIDGVDEFKYTKDHSKYARTLTSCMPVVCIGDINRMTSQYKRGGGAVCIQDLDLWNAWNVFDQVPTCPTGFPFVPPAQC